VKVAKFSPNGEWICSGDAGGTTNVWAHGSFVIKNTIQIGKSCLDIAWDGEGKRIAAVGVGKDDKGKVFPWNTNNKLGELTGSSRSLLSCDFRPCRPFRVITGGEDYGVYNYKGPPFKFQTYDKTHSNYVNCVRYRPAGDIYLSASSDKRILVFDGKSGQKTGEIKDPNKKNNHTGSIYEISWSPDGTRFLTASADRTCKVWNYEEGVVEHTFRFADKPGIQDMQVSCLWMADYMLSISLSGKINFLSPSQERPVSILTGHRETCTDVVVDRNLQQVYSCDIDSRICVTQYKTGLCVDFQLAGGDNPHSGKQLKFVCLSCDYRTLYSCASDDTVCLSPAIDLSSDMYSGMASMKKGDDNSNSNSNENDNNYNSNNNNNDSYGDYDASKYSAKGSVIKLPGAARIILTGKSNPNLCVIATHNQQLLFFNSGELVNKVVLDFEPAVSGGDISADDNFLAICEKGQNNACHILEINGEVGSAKECGLIKNNFVRGAMLRCAFSPDGAFLATTEQTRHIWFWDFVGRNFEEPVNRANTCQYHVAVVTSLEWSADSLRLISAGFDGIIYLWLNPTKGRSDNCKIENSFVGSIKKVTYVNEDTIVGVGADSTVRFFKIVEPQ
jgi:WD40 repeat protein